MRIAVFGSSDIQPYGTIYNLARRIGRFLAKQDVIVMLSGELGERCGVAEAVTEGIENVAPDATIKGCTVGKFRGDKDSFPARSLLSAMDPTVTLPEEHCARWGWFMTADGFVAIPGCQGGLIGILIFIHLCNLDAMKGKRLAILLEPSDNIVFFKVLEFFGVSNEWGKDGCIEGLPVMITHSPKKAVDFVTAEPT